MAEPARARARTHTHTHFYKLITKMKQIYASWENLEKHNRRIESDSSPWEFSANLIGCLGAGDVPVWNTRALPPHSSSLFQEACVSVYSEH